MVTTTRTRLLLALLLVFGLIAAACGGSDDGDGDAGSTDSGGGDAEEAEVTSPHVYMACNINLLMGLRNTLHTNLPGCPSQTCLGAITGLHA